MSQVNSFHKLKISTLGSVSAPTCLGLAERTFGKKSPEYRVGLELHKGKTGRVRRLNSRFSRRIRRRIRRLRQSTSGKSRDTGFCRS